MLIKKNKYSPKKMILLSFRETFDSGTIIMNISLKTNFYQNILDNHHNTKSKINKKMIKKTKISKK